MQPVYVETMSFIVHFVVFKSSWSSSWSWNSIGFRVRSRAWGKIKGDIK